MGKHTLLGSMQINPCGGTLHEQAEAEQDPQGEDMESEEEEGSGGERIAEGITTNLHECRYRLLSLSITFVPHPEESVKGPPPPRQPTITWIICRLNSWYEHSKKCLREQPKRGK